MKRPRDFLSRFACEFRTVYENIFASLVCDRSQNAFIPAMTHGFKNDLKNRQFVLAQNGHGGSESDIWINVEIARCGNLQHEFSCQAEFKNDGFPRVDSIPCLFQK